VSLVRRAAVLPVVLVLAGCAGGTDSELRADVAAVVEAANAGDADRLRVRADELVETVDAQQESGELPADRAERLRALAASVRTNADVIDEELIEQRRQEAEAEAERQRLEEERQRLEEERQQLEQDRKKAEEENKKDEDKGRGKGKGGDGDDDD
jgi:chromosome segregation ATPase